MRKKSDEQILGEVKAEILRMFGTEQKSKATRHKDPLDVILWQSGDKRYRNRNNALAAGVKPKRVTMDALTLMEFWESEGYEPKIEDMTHEEYLKMIQRKVSEYKGERS